MSSYFQDLVRRHDYDRYLLSFFAPADRRGALWALFAFNYEVAKTREVVSDTTIGLIRLQWWRDAIAEIYEGKPVRRHGVVQPLAEAIEKYDLLREDFDNLIYAREFDLEGVAPINIEGLIKYCDFTATPLMRLAVKIIGEEVQEETLKDVAVHYALIGILRAVAYMRQHRRLMLPQEMMQKQNVEESKFFDFNNVENIQPIIKEILARFSPCKNSPKSKFLKTANGIAEIYAGQLKKAEYNVFDTALQHRPAFFQLRVWLKSF